MIIATEIMITLANSENFISVNSCIGRNCATKPKKMNDT